MAPGDRGSVKGWRTLAAVLTAASAALALSARPAVAAAGSLPAFNPPEPLPAGAGSLDPSLVVDPGGPVGVLASTAPGEGCTMFSISHSGGEAAFLGRLAGGTGCALAATDVRGTSELDYSAAEWQVPVDGQSQTGGASFNWASTSASAMGSLAADPAPDATGTTALYEVVADPAAGPRIAVSLDGGRTFAAGSPLIDPATVPAAQWSGSGPAPVVGNLVARRDATGLTLFSAFETADGAADRSAQAAAGTDNLNHLYAAVGRVTPGVAGGAPAVTWTESPVYAEPAGSALNRALPSIAVDGAGHVYVAFSDDRHVYVAESPDGLTWSGPPVVVDAVATGLPDHLDAALLPSIAAAGTGGADLAWYAATGGAGASADPSDDKNNTWNVLMAQTLDAGRTWSALPVTQSAVHTGPLCVAADTVCTAAPAAATYPDTALQIAVDQVTGAAVAAFAGDDPSQGTLSLLATRQCTGSSALTGTPLVDDCVALQPAAPVLPGSSCPGPQITHPGGDAVRTMAPNAGADVPSLDVLDVRLQPQDATTELATLSVNSMSTTLPQGVESETWRVAWTLNGQREFAEASLAGGAAMGYAVGTLNSDGSVVRQTAVQGAVSPGPGGGVQIQIPHDDIGNPATGAALQDLYAASYVQYAGSPASLGEQLIDRAPDGGYGADYAVGTVCPPAEDLPDAPAAVLLPLVGGAAAAGVAAYRRRRSSRRATAAGASRS